MLVKFRSTLIQPQQWLIATYNWHHSSFPGARESQESWHPFLNSWEWKNSSGNRFPTVHYSISVWAFNSYAAAMRPALHWQVRRRHVGCINFVSAEAELSQRTDVRHINPHAVLRNGTPWESKHLTAMSQGHQASSTLDGDYSREWRPYGDYITSVDET